MVSQFITNMTSIIIIVTDKIFINQQHHHRPYHPHHHPHVNISIKLDRSQVLCGRFNFPLLPSNNAPVLHSCISLIKSPLYSKLHPVSNNAYVIHSRISSIKSSVYSKLHSTISLFRCPLYPMSHIPAVLLYSFISYQHHIYHTHTPDSVFCRVHGGVFLKHFRVN